MTDQTLPPVTAEDFIRKPAGHILLSDVSEEDFMELYAQHHCEWVRGYLIKMSPVSLPHDRIVHYVRPLVEAYFSLKPFGTIVGEPFVMKLEGVRANREPDLQIILGANRDNVKHTKMNGPADICIEVVSPGSVETDYGDKFVEYERGGVKEYWLLDPMRSESNFYRLNDEGVYQRVDVDEDGHYRTPLLPGFALHVETLWETELPDIIAVVQAVQKMLKE
ncbi:MAG: Uma2 family endonuclease [Burkholderiales bacterium]|nr:Uma2 family endonuclease [Anaerolineae bacterium]